MRKHQTIPSPQMIISVCGLSDSCKGSKVLTSVRLSTITRPLASSRTFSTGCGPRGLGPCPSGSTLASRSCTLSR